VSGVKGSTLRILAVAVVVLAALGSVALLAPKASAGDAKIVVALDFSHGESHKYVNYIVGNLSNIADFVFINESITPDILKNVNVLIIGQPTTSFSASEIKAIVDWLQSGKRVLWIAGDSDYGSGPNSQKAVNALLEAIGARLRLEYGSVYDAVHCAGAFYRVLGQVKPDNIPGFHTDIISQGISKPVLYHGPDVVIWVDSNGNYHDPVTETFPGLIRIVWNYVTAYIADNNPPPLVLYDPTVDTNRTFVMLAAEVQDNDLIVVSGESPYGDYEPTWSWFYHGVELDGPKFVSNMIKWFQWWVTSPSVPPLKAPPPVDPHTGKPMTTTTATTTTPATTTTTTTTTSPTTTSPTTSPATSTYGSPTQTATITPTTTTTAKKSKAVVWAVIIIIIIIIIAAAVALARR
jgi:hypothetical protein